MGWGWAPYVRARQKLVQIGLIGVADGNDAAVGVTVAAHSISLPSTVLNSGQAELPDNPTLVAQLSGLERRRSKVGRDTITHCDGGHDDVANSACGVLVNLTLGQRYGMLDDHVLGITPGTERELAPYWERYAYTMAQRRGL